ncbi:hypothetical protein A2Z23_03080 [Candidatus Curtissbacteria bacterium RBG_16_39_7]|uniref:Uncharacterized protein n=1 Tax=Candidatus Curtissbacteria bacterium RBG_16_39_7 TaxID=1797707 RepID=A0A1F5G493_9BACT|nr:MAG: hypothetical protein A2Z23_03080 [Candidatus Curtissbacteria bacterium RBG_16_39_7]
MVVESEKEAPRALWKRIEGERTPINELVVEQESLQIRQILEPTLEHARYYSIGRNVQQIIVEGNDLSFGICQDAPVRTQFKTFGGMTGIFSKFDHGVPSAGCGKGEDENPVVLYNPEILNLRGGVLAIFHEEGHAWQMVKRQFSEREVANGILRNFNLIQRNKGEIVWAVALINQQENDAWNFAIDKYWEYREKGLNIAPRISEQELVSYPQHWLDIYNREHGEVTAFFGKKKLFVWRPRE